MATLQTREHAEPQGALGEALAQVAARERHQRCVRGGIRGLALALVLDIVLAALGRAGVLPDMLPLSPTLCVLMLCILAIAGAAAGAHRASRSPLSPMDAARLAEVRLPLKERLSSALEFGQAPGPSPLLALQHADAEAHARSLDTRGVVPRRLPREAWLLAPLLLVLALMLLLPALPFGPTRAQRAEQDAVRQAGSQLAQAAHQAAAEADARHDPAAAREARKAEALGKRLAQGHMDRAQALAAVAHQTQQIAPQNAPGAGTPGQAGQTLADTARTPVPDTAGASRAPAGAQTPASPQGRAAPVSAAPGAPGASSGPSHSFPSAKSSQPAKQAAAAGQSSPATQAPHAGASAAPPSRPPAQPSKPGETAPAQTPSAPSQDTPGARQALEDARRRLAGSPPSGATPPAGPADAKPPAARPGSAKPGTAARPGTSGKPSSTPSPGAGKPNAPHNNGSGKPGEHGQSSTGKPGSTSSPKAGKPGGQGQAGGGTPSSHSSSHAGAPERQTQGGSGKASNVPASGAGKAGNAPASGGKGQSGKPGSGGSAQNGGSPTGGPGAPAHGGGAGQAAKAPFRAVLPPTTASRSRAISLGVPRAGGGQTAPTQGGLPLGPAGASRVPYGSALPRYRKSTEAALEQDRVPPSQRALVRSYFNSLPPAK